MINIRYNNLKVKNKKSPLLYIELKNLKIVIEYLEIKDFLKLIYLNKFF